MQTKYWVVLGGCLTQFTVIGLLFSFGLFIKVLETEFGWSRTMLSACSSVAFLMMGILAMVAGPLTDRFGPSRVLLVTGLAYGVGFALISQVTQPWQLFLVFATLIGLGLSTHDVVTLSTVARWFEARRGIMTAVVKVGTAIGQISLPPLAALLILGVGWQMALIFMGIGAMIILSVAALLMRRPGVVSAHGAPVEAPGFLYGEARKTRTFWTLCAIQFLFFPSMMAVPLHLPVHGMDLGMTPATAATLLSVVGASSIAGRLTIGRVLDKIGGKNAFTLCFIALIIGLLGLTLSQSQLPLYLTLAVYGFGHGGLFVVVSPTVAEHFGMRAHGAIFGTILFFGTLGGAAGPILVGAVFDTTGSYVLGFAGLLTLAIIGVILVLSLPAPGRISKPSAA